MATISQVPSSRFDGHGPIGFKITVDKNSWLELNKLKRGLDKTTSVIDNKETVASGIATLGQRMVYNHVTSGGVTGRWKSLSEETLRIRKQRGYINGRILQQSSELYSKGIFALGEWKPTQGNYSATIAATPMQTLAREGRVREITIEGISGPTGVAASIGHRSFFAIMNGPKAANQEGGTMSYASGQSAFLPARPFWFFDQVGVDKAAEIMMNNFLGRWVENMPNPVGAAHRGVMGSGVISVSSFSQGMGPALGPSA